MDAFLSLSGEPLDLRRGGSRSMAIIIPCYNELKLLEEHLGLLQKQTFREFDVILVLSNLLDANEVAAMVKKAKSSALILKRAEDTGSAGGFYLGAKYAYKEGYNAVVFADVDAMPGGDDLLESLWDAYKEGSGFVMPQSEFMADGEAVARERVLNQYCLVSRATIEKAGFHFAPAYLGAEDAEYAQRLKKIEKPKLLENKVFHPITEFGARSFMRSSCYSLNFALLTIPDNFIYYAYLCGLVAPAFLSFGAKPVREGGMRILSGLLMQEYGKKAYGDVKSEEPPSQKPDLADFSAILSPSGSFQGKPAIKYSYSGAGGSKLSNATELSRKLLWKKTLLSKVNLLTVVSSLLLSREVSMMKSDGSAYLLKKDRGMFGSAISVLAFLVLVPVCICATFITLPLNIIRKPKTAGYGL